MSETTEIMALVVVEASEGREDECPQLLHAFYAVLRRKQYSRDLLYRDVNDPRRFVNLRYWWSEDARREAHEDPDIHAFWKRLSEIASVAPVYERLEEVTPLDSTAKGEG